MTPNKAVREAHSADANGQWLGKALSSRIVAKPTLLWCKGNSIPLAFPFVILYAQCGAFFNSLRASTSASLLANPTGNTFQPQYYRNKRG
jgi:hypothetical protein